MHVLYVHQNYPAQFGHIARHLVKDKGYRCSFVSRGPARFHDGIECIQYQLAGGASRQNHFCSRTFENAIWHSDAVFKALAGRPDIQPDLIVGHSGFGSTLFLRELYPKVPVINLFEYYYRPRHLQSDMDFRRDLGWKMTPDSYNRAAASNAMILLDLQNCDTGYSPTEFQRSTFPSEYQPKLKCVFDGIDRTIYHSHDGSLRPINATRPARTLAGVDLPADAKIVTYVSRGFESMRGFDIFLHAADRVCRKNEDAHVLVVGTEQIAYGGDKAHLNGHPNFKEWVLAQREFDLSRIHFVGRIPPARLARVLAASDAHVYLTVPFVLSWSMVNAMSCGAVVIGSDTNPVQEMIADGETGLLCDFFDADGLANRVLDVLAHPAHFRPLGEAAERLIESRYSLEAVIPPMLQMYEEAMEGAR
jgi:glycosyltransferase involved in cell wall biosynthesis